jgi:hypothetical protein
MPLHLLCVPGGGDVENGMSRGFYGSWGEDSQEVFGEDRRETELLALGGRIEIGVGRWFVSEQG